MQAAEIKPTNLNYLFIDMVSNYRHLITKEPQTKQQFLDNIKKAYSLSNPKNELFYIAVQKSTFDTIRLNLTRESILFNQ